MEKKQPVSFEEKKKAIERQVEDLAGTLTEMAQNIFRKPETSFQEYYASTQLMHFLKGEGFQVESGVAGMETAFRARWIGEEGGPCIAFLCEYDALPEIGHGCGHHLIGVGGAGAAASLARAWPKIPGTIEVLGTPAEEGGGGKVLMVQEGVFQQVDAALMFHPTTVEHLVVRGGTALLPVTLKYRGQAAHAASDPHLGINALDAVLQVFHSVNALREHLKDDVRIHGCIKQGGTAPNVVPDYGEAEFYLRSKSTRYLQEVLRPRFTDIAQAAALATGATLELEEGLLFAERSYSTVLVDVFAANLKALGETSAPPDPAGGFGSSDIGNVSLLVPTIHPYIAITGEDIPHHSPQFAAKGITPQAFSALLLATRALAMTGFDLFASPEILAAAWRIHKEAVKG